MPFTDAHFQVNYIESLVMKSFLERYGFLPKAWTRYLTFWVPLIYHLDFEVLLLNFQS